MKATSFLGRQSQRMMDLVIGPCDGVRDFLADYLEHRLPPLTALRFAMHLQLCPRCRRYLERYKRAIEYGQRIYSEPPPEELVDLTLTFLDRHLPKEPTPPKDPSS